MKKWCLVFLIGSLFLTSCQKQPISSSDPSSDQQSPSSLNPQAEQGARRPLGYQPPQQTWFFGLFKKKQKMSWGDQLIAEYEDRMKRNAKEAKKKAKDMEKPQYSDWTYFGHKKKPKKRDPDKMKYCDECGIRH